MFALSCSGAETLDQQVLQMAVSLNLSINKASTSNQNPKFIELPIHKYAILKPYPLAVFLVIDYWSKGFNVVPKESSSSWAAASQDATRVTA